ncbi:MAG: cupin domain-containing protein [Bacteroidota bacterium]
MKITRLAEAPNIPFALDGKVMLKSDDLEIIHLRLNPGQKLENHRNPFDTVFYILEGQAIIETMDGVALAEPDMIIELNQTAERSVLNTGATDFRMLVLKKIKTVDK